MQQSIGVKFENGPKIHYLEVPGEVPAPGTRCVVSTRRGLELALVRTGVTEKARPSGQVLRTASQADLEQFRLLGERAEDLKWLLRARARQNGMDIKIISLEFTIDESLLVVSYTAEEAPSLRLLAQELARHTAARVEFSNIGPREQARILGTLGSCGSGNCSSTWMQSFASVSIRMARDQQLPLNPEKISGPCGRLMCCLQFEHEMYRELLRDMPKKGVKACHSSGACGRIVKVNPLKGTVELKTEQGPIEEYPAAEVERMRR
jgi:cell fate regulator YaaT (PSP1 superfamily)